MVFLYLKNILTYLTSGFLTSSSFFFINKIFNYYHYLNFWIHLKSRFSLKTITHPSTNFIKSLNYWNHQNTVTWISKTSYDYNLIHQCTAIYLYTIKVLTFPFHKKVYNSFMIFILVLLSSNYFSFKNSFQLFYSFILKPNNFQLFFFLNRFYFPVFNI